jgi:hypothetical protein
MRGLLHFTWGGLLAIVLLLVLILFGYDARTRRTTAAIVAALVISLALTAGSPRLRSRES